MYTYQPMTCQCGDSIIPSVIHVNRAKTATKYSDCYYQCKKCGCGFSNAKDEGNRRKIFRRWKDNIPNEVQDGLEQIITHTLNNTNRNSKFNRLAFETSEDAVTWVVFRYLYQTKQLGPAFGFDQHSCEALLLWGAPWPLESSGELRQELTKVLIQVLCEVPDRLTEPDIIISLPEHLLFVEAKYTSGNDCKRKYHNFPRYLEPNRGLFNQPAADISAMGYYELTRNWVAGSLLAERLKKKFVLINLAQSSCKQCEQSATQFGESLKISDARQFRFCTWSTLLSKARKPLSPWFDDYLKKRDFSN